ncbi:CpsD/CapB family tyrosine-protein kinase [Microcoleus sp. Pol14D5]
MATIPLPEPSEKLLGFAAGDVRARPFKLLRTMLGRQLSEGKANLIGITSASPNAGKSFSASNLAAAMSSIASQKVILADFDLQRASIAEIFGIGEAPGLADYLIDEAVEVSDVMRRFGDTCLSIAPTLRRPVDSATLLASERFAELIRTWKEDPSHPTIICDLPPLFVSDDAMLIAKHLDGVIVVVEQGVTTKKQLEASLQLLSPVKLMGTVFNRFAGGFGDPYGYSDGYGSYYN